MADPRRWNDDPDLRKIPQLVQEGRTEEAKNILNLASGRANDYFFVLDWLATIEEKTGNVPNARRILIDGISKSRLSIHCFNSR